MNKKQGEILCKILSKNPRGNLWVISSRDFRLISKGITGEISGGIPSGIFKEIRGKNLTP